MKRKIGLYFRVGIEMGNFILSGLANDLQKKGFEVIILTSQKNHFFDKMLKRYGLKQINIDFLDLDNQKRHNIEKYFLASRRARLRLNGFRTFAYWNDTPKKRFKDYLIGNRLVYEFFRFFTFRKLDKQYYNQKLVNFFKKEHFTDIVLQTYAMPQNMAIAINAKNNGLKVWLMNWGWKDFYINEWVPFMPDKFFVWSQYYKELYLKYNTHIDEKNIISVGNPNFDTHFGYTPKFDLEFYEQKYNISKNKKIFLYAMIHPDVYNDENVLIEGLLKVLSEKLPETHLVLKPNPMDKNLERYQNILNRYNNVSMMENLWNFDKKTDFNLITQEAKDEWLDMIYHSYGMLSIPSTVAIESLILKKPVISIGYGASIKDKELISRFANAEFYKPLFLRSDVVLSHTYEETCNFIELIINNKINVSESLERFIDENGNATQQILCEIEKG